MSSTNRTLDAFLIQKASQYSLSRTFKPGQTIFAEGEPGSTMLLILVGTVRILKTGPDTNSFREIAKRGAGDFLGEMAMLEASPRFATVVAETECEVLEFSRQNFEKVIREQPALATRVLRSLSSKLRESDSVRICELEDSNRLLRAANEELIRLNSFLDRIVDQSPSAILLTTHDGAIYRLNNAAMRMFELDSIDDDANVDGLFRGVDFVRLRSEVGRSWHGEAKGIRKSEPFPVYLSVSSLYGHGDSLLYLIICQDISDLHTFNQTMLQVEKYEAEKETAMELAHDLKNYLGVLTGSMELILIRMTQGQREKSANAVKAIERTSQEILSFVENMMIYRDDKAAYTGVNLRTLVSVLLHFFRSQARFQDITFSLEVDSDFPDSLQVKEEQIRRVLLNLLGNAAEALKLAGGNVSKSVVVRLKYEADSKQCIILVSDNGPGIDAKNIAKVFNSRFTTKSDGHGIGLISVARIVQGHDGHVSVDSTPGKGAAFRIALPVERDPQIG